MFVDYHVHSDYSVDSVFKMEDVVLKAIEIGLKEICFTDHVDYGTQYDWDDVILETVDSATLPMNVNYPEYFKELDYLIDKYAGDIVIKRGLEFGIQTHTVDLYRKLIDTNPMDFVLLSIHQVNDLEFWNNVYQVGRSTQECYDGYYNEMYEVMRVFKDYSVLAHLDLMRRYTEPEDYFENTKEDIEKILKLAIADGKGIEINTSHVRYGVDGLTPSIEVLKLYHELGGKIITIGSDSHQADHLGFLVEESKNVLREIGFEYFCTYKNMEPIFHRL